MTLPWPKIKRVKTKARKATVKKAPVKWHMVKGVAGYTFGVTANLEQWHMDVYCNQDEKLARRIWRLLNEDEKRKATK